MREKELTPEERLIEWMGLIASFPDTKGDTKGNPDWMSSTHPHLTLHSTAMPGTSPGTQHPTATFAFTVPPSHANGLNNLHGGAAASLFDYTTSLSLALVARPGAWQHLGVSRTLNVTYLRPVPVGTDVLVQCEVVAAGKVLSALRGTIRRKSDGAILVVCEHQKFNTDPPAAKM
ncbi:Acyl-coenzyme A thioesterase 13 like protein [Verticillium longisporum]|uniref:Acyl-coenzyme A thioesterase 13 like protein n=1 Tax=Verticillium longisporum TaxID=100787 RepID=A0A8I2Z6Y0_VERLO|nr:Acyl-coenzyme A thioesterase 13 like protein [Verticillium longisporum]RBQ69107.1 hypothetical protein VDGD_21571 [Verticillium dahliae]